MSHFTVAVITDSLDKVEALLAPYQENNMGDCPMEYMEFRSASKEYKDEYENESNEMVRLPDGSLINTYDNRCYRVITKEEYDVIKKQENHPSLSYSSLPTEEYKVYDLSAIGGEAVSVPYKQLYPTFKEYLEDYIETRYDESQQDWGHWENPNAKWDWYTMGGRWSGSLLVKEESNGELGRPGLFGACDHDDDDKVEGCRWVDCAKIKDVLWDKMLELDQIRMAETYDKVMNDESERKYAVYLHGIKDGMTKEEYVADASRFSTFAVITPDGKWHEKGEMGWWACVTNENPHWNDCYYEAFLRNADPESWIVVVDCHI